MLIYLKPLSLFPDLHSDTLFGAITFAISELYPEKVDEMISEFNNNQPPFLISSAFPFAYCGEEKIRFFPKLILNQKENNLDTDTLKKYKNIKFMEEDLFYDLIKGDISELDILNNFNDYYSFKGFLMKNDYGIDIDLGEDIVSNNSINPLTNETKIFYSSSNRFKNMGMFFLVEFNNPDYESLILAGIKFLKDRGFGKDISTGKGHFDYEIDENYSIYSQFEHKDNFNYFTTLSRFIPTREDLVGLDENASYEFGSKRGKSSSYDVRRQVRFFNEGSVFFNDDSKKYFGKTVSSGNKSPAVEYGFAFPLYCVGNSGDLND